MRRQSPLSHHIASRVPRPLHALLRVVCLLLLLTSSVALTQVVSPALAHAQDSPEKRTQNIQRLRDILEKNPTEGFVLTQLLRLVGRGQQLDALIDEYKSLASKNPSKIAYPLIQGHLLKAAQRYDQAIEAYRKATAVDAKNSDAWLGLGLALQLHKRDSEAKPALEKALSLVKDPIRKMDVLRKLAALAFAARNWEDADRFYSSMIRLEPKETYIRKEYIDELVKYKRYEKALEQSNALVKQAGRNVKERAEAQRDLGDIYVLMERYDDALRTWKTVVNSVSADNYLRREIEDRIIALYRERNDLEGLVKQYESQWKRPTYEQAYTLGTLYEELGDEAKAMSYYRAALKKSKSSVDARLRVLRILERQGKNAEVVKEYEALIKSDSKQASYRFELARIHNRNGDTKKAMKVASDIERNFSSDIVVLTNLAEQYLRWDSKKNALSIYKKLVKIDPQNPDHLIGLGEFYWQDGDRDTALATWAKIPKVMPIPAEGFATYGQVLAEHNLPDKAVQQYVKALNLDPKNAQLYRSLAQVYERSRRMDKAIEAWTTLLNQTDRDFLKREARSRIIRILSSQNALRKKLAEWETRFAPPTNDREAGYFLGEAYAALRDFKKGEEVFQKLLSQNPKDQQSLLSLDKMYKESGELQKNIKVLETLAAMDPLRAREYYHQISELSLRLYEDDRAVLFAKKAVEANPTDANALARLGAVYRQMQDLPRAAAQYQSAIENDSTAYRYYFELAEIYLTMDKIRDAELLFRKLVNESRDEMMILRAGRKSIDINDVLGSLDLLESVLAPKLTSQRPKPVYTRLLIELYDRMTRPLLNARLYAPKEQRAQADRDLRAISRRALSPLMQALRDPDISTRLTVIRILGDLQDPNAAASIAALTTDRDPEIRAQAALAVGKLANPNAAASTTRLLNNSDQVMRELAAWALGRMKSKDALGPLETALKNDSTWTVRALSAVSIGRIQDPKSIATLSKRLSDPTGRDGHAEVRVACAWALGNFANPKALPGLEKALTQETNADVRRMVTWALGNIQSKDATKRLFSLYFGADHDLHHMAAHALLRASSPNTSPYALWQDSPQSFYNPSTRAFNVSFFLTTLLSDFLLAQPTLNPALLTQAQPTITSLLNTQLTSLQGDALTRLLYDLDQLPNTLSLGLLTLSNPGEPLSKTSPLKPALASIASSIAPKLAAILSDTKKPPIARAHAASILGKTSAPSAQNALRNALKDPNKDIRSKAALSLGAMRDASSTNDLLALLSDPSWAVRSHAALALGRLGDKRATDPLIKALSDRSSWVQGNAAVALGDLGDTRASKPLIQQLDTAPVAIKIDILRALAKIGGTDAKSTLERFRSDPNPNIRALLKNL